MGVVRRETFDRSVLPNYMTKEVKDAIEAAVMLGWTLHIASDGQSVAIWSYDERKKIHFNTRRSTPMRRAKADILRHADPVLREKAKEGEGGAYGVVVERNDAETVQVHEDPRPDAPVWKTCSDAVAHVDHHRHRWYAKADTERLHPFDCIGYESAVVTTTPSIISEHPMLAKAGTRSGYFSPTTNERIWSDGRKDYACRLDGCDYTSEDRQAVGNHWATKRDHPDTGKRDRFPADVPDATHYAPRQIRVDVLAGLLADLFDPDSPPDFEAMARAALTWVHEQSNQGNDLSAEREEMSADETLARIRALLDNGQTRTLLRENEALTERIVEAEARAGLAERKAQRAHEQWTALVELISEAEKDAG